MAKDLRKLIILIVMMLSIQSIYAQLGISHEIGAFIVPVSFQYDFGFIRDF